MVIYFPYFGTRRSIKASLLHSHRFITVEKKGQALSNFWILFTLQTKWMIVNYLNYQMCPQLTKSLGHCMNPWLEAYMTYTIIKAGKRSAEGHNKRSTCFMGIYHSCLIRLLSRWKKYKNWHSLKRTDGIVCATYH